MIYDSAALPLVPGPEINITVPRKFLAFFRKRFLKNPLLNQHDPSAVNPWIRTSLFMCREVVEPEDASFHTFDYIRELMKRFNVKSNESFADTLAVKVFSELQRLSTQATIEDVRRKLITVNTIHSSIFDINLGEPELDKFAGHSAMLSLDEQSEEVRVASIVQRGGKTHIHRVGNFSPSDEDLSLLHPIARKAVEVLHSARDLAIGTPKYDCIESGPWGVRFGLLGWNTLSQGAGRLLATFFESDYEDYREPKTAVYPNKFGDITNFYGWPLSSTEVCSPDILMRILLLLTKKQNLLLQMQRANEDVELFLNEAGIRYVHQEDANNLDHYAHLFLVFLHSSVESWYKLVAQIKDGTLDMDYLEELKPYKF